MTCIADLGYKIERRNGDREINRLICEYCGVGLHLRHYHRAGDLSGQGRYNRARAVIVHHIHECHADTHRARLLAATSAQAQQGAKA